jgi:hypothetical protein
MAFVALKNKLSVFFYCRLRGKVEHSRLSYANDILLAEEFLKHIYSNVCSRKVGTVKTISPPSCLQNTITGAYTLFNVDCSWNTLGCKEYILVIPLQWQLRETISVLID